jgi:hypothetical protein
MGILIRLTLCVSLFAISLTGTGQSLQFSQVLLITTTQTVPANKVWKVESYTPSTAYGVHSGTPQTHAILVNSLSRIVGMVAGGNVNNNYAHSAYSFNSFPMWLPAGTTLAVSSGVSQLSVIEFTVLP